MAGKTKKKNRNGFFTVIETVAICVVVAGAAFVAGSKLDIID